MVVCSGCRAEMPVEVIKPMVHILNKRAMLELLCPFCQQRYGDHNPDYYYINIDQGIMRILAQVNNIQ